MPGMTRRLFVGTAAAAGLAPSLLAAEASPSLHRLARDKNMRFGSCVAWSAPGADAGSFANPHYAALLERDCGILVPENEFKWQRVRPDARRFDFSAFDPMLGYAEKHGMAMRGHTLLWHKPRYFPKWLNEHDFGASPAREGERLLTEHVRTLCTRYGKRITSFDVVNETIDEKTGQQHESVLAKAFGSAEAMIDLAFHTARVNAPGVQLVYNDYMSWEPGNENHRAGVLRLLEGFRKRGVPVDALGVQSHIAVGGDGAAGRQAAQQEKAWRQFLDAVVAMDYKLVITEFDVNDRALPTDKPVRDAAVADYAAAYLDIMFSYPQLRDVLVWGMCDRYSWLTGFMPRKDGGVQRATPYDTDFNPKPLRQVFAGAFARTARRTA